MNFTQEIHEEQEQFSLQQSQAIRDLEGTISEQGRFASFHRAATLRFLQSTRERNSGEYQPDAPAEKVHCCNGLIPFNPFVILVNFMCVVSFSLCVYTYLIPVYCIRPLVSL